MEIKEIEEQTEMKMMSVKNFNIKTIYDVQELRRQTWKLIAEDYQNDWQFDEESDKKIDFKKEVENVKISQRARMCDMNLKKIEKYILNFEI